MPYVDFTLDDLDKRMRGIVRDELKGVKDDVAGLKTDVSGLKTDVSGLKTDVSGLKTDVASLKTNVSGLRTDVSALRTELKTDIAELRTDLTEKIDGVKSMLEEDNDAESGRLDSTDRRLKKLRREFNQHVADQSLHRV